MLTANADYWGENQPSIETLIFRAIADGPARRQALEAGEIDGYDLVDPADAAALEEARLPRSCSRPAFNVGYIGFNSSIAPLDNPDIRKAIAYAINKENILSTKYPEGAEVATQFMPPELFGWNDDVEAYAYDPDDGRAADRRVRRDRTRRSSSGTRRTSAGRTCRTRRATSS